MYFYDNGECESLHSFGASLYLFGIQRDKFDEFNEFDEQSTRFDSAFGWCQGGRGLTPRRTRRCGAGKRRRLESDAGGPFGAPYG
jgi:hypothetical protein